MSDDDASALRVDDREDPVVFKALGRQPDRDERQRLAPWIGAGLIAGLAMASLSPRQWSRLGSALFGGGARILLSPVGPALLAAILARASAHAAEVRAVNVELRTFPPNR
jgi:hypothetical protein